MSDLIRGNISHPYQYTAITSMDGANADMLMDYGILRLNQGMCLRTTRRWKRPICWCTAG